MSLPTKEKTTDTVPGCECELKYYDILCCGAGPAGLYLGYLMTKNKSDKSLLILEKLDRVGGMCASVSFKGNVPYEAEGCAQRFRDNQLLIKSLVEEFEVGYVVASGSYSATTDSAKELLDQIVQKYGDSCDNSDVSNLDALVNTPSIEEGSYDNIANFINATGYTENASYMNLSAFFDDVVSVTPSTQNFVAGGFQHLFQKVHEHVAARYDVLLGTPMTNITYDECSGCYIVNNKYMCKKIVLTCPPYALNDINTNSLMLQQTRKFIRENIGVGMYALRMYVHVENPWWDAEKLPVSFKNIGPLSMMSYLTPNDFMLYNYGVNSDLLRSMMPRDLWNEGKDQIKWIDMDRAPRLKRFIAHYVKKLVLKGQTQSPDFGLKMPTDEELDTMTEFAFKHTKDAVVMYGQMSCDEWQNFFNLINNRDNLHIVGGAYNRESGWVNGAFANILENYDNIVNI